MKKKEKYYKHIPTKSPTARCARHRIKREAMAKTYIFDLQFLPYNNLVSQPTMLYVSINSVICACCITTSVVNCIGNVVGIDGFWVVHFPGARQRILNSFVQTLPVFVLSNNFWTFQWKPRVTHGRKVTVSILNFMRFFSGTSCMFQFCNPSINVDTSILNKYPLYFNHVAVDIEKLT